MGIKYKSVAHGLDSFVIKPTNLKRTEAYNAFVKADALRLSNHFRESIKHYLQSLMMDRNNYRVYKGLGISYKAGTKVGILKSLPLISSYIEAILYKIFSRFFKLKNSIL